MSYKKIRKYYIRKNVAEITFYVLNLNGQGNLLESKFLSSYWNGFSRKCFVLVFGAISNINTMLCCMEGKLFIEGNWTQFSVYMLYTLFISMNFAEHNVHLATCCEDSSSLRFTPFR